MKVLVKCDNCKEDYNTSLVEYHRKQRANITLNELGKPATFCSKLCASSYRKNINHSKKEVPFTKEPELTAKEELDLWFSNPVKVPMVPINSLASTKIIGGVLANPDNFNDGVSDNLLSKEIVMSETADVIAAILAKNPEYATVNLVEVLKQESLGAVNSMPMAATPIAVQPSIVQPVPVQSMPVVPAQAGLIQPSQAPVQPVSKWQDSLDNKGEVCKCDADFWDAQKTMKKCNFNSALNRFKYSVIDGETGQLIFTPQNRDCYRCQGKGFLTAANLGYNWESDMKRGVIPVTTTWEQYQMERLG